MPKKGKKKSATKATNRTATTSSPDWAVPFLAALRDVGTILGACRAAGVSRSAVYDRRDGDAAFARALAEAIEDATDDLEQEARKRAKDGDNALLVTLLRAYRPERFRDRVEVSGTTTRVNVPAEALSDDQLAAIAARAAE